MPASHVEVEMIGPIAFDIPTRPLVFEGAAGGRVTITLHRGAYHTLAREGMLPRGAPDVVLALNAGLAAMGYGWAPTLEVRRRHSA